MRTGVDLNGKPVACFGCGDSVSYGDYFAVGIMMLPWFFCCPVKFCSPQFPALFDTQDAIEELYSNFKKTGAKMVGHFPTEGYEHSYSKSEIEEGMFCGLPLDQVRTFHHLRRPDLPMC